MSESEPQRPKVYVPLSREERLALARFMARDGKDCRDLLDRSGAWMPEEERWRIEERMLRVGRLAHKLESARGPITAAQVVYARRVLGDVIDGELDGGDRVRAVDLHQRLRLRLHEASDAAKDGLSVASVDDA